MNRIIAILLALGLVVSCAPLQESFSSKTVPLPPAHVQRDRGIPGPDAGAGIPLETLHFILEAYGRMKQDKARVVNRIYSEVMDKTGLYSFEPSRRFRVVIYRNKEEFMLKTGQPEWSGGMKTGGSVFTYEQGGIDEVLAHEITHVIFGEYLGEAANNYRWLNEGLAMYIDAGYHNVYTRDERQSQWLHIIRHHDLLTMEQITAFAPYSEKSREVNVWYNTVARLTGYLIENGGAFNFSLFLKELRQGEDVRAALGKAYPGKYATLEELYAVWKAAEGL